jgi:AraC-like DNA-binding protein
LALTRASLVSSQAKFFRQIGAPVDSALARNCLPSHIEEIPDAWVPYANTRRFMADMVLQEGLYDPRLWRDVCAFSALGSKYRYRILSTANLLEALHRMAGDARLQNSAASVWLELDGEHARSCVAVPWARELGHAIAETLNIALMRSVIGAYAGRDLTPTRILLQATEQELHFNPADAYEDVPVLTGQPCTALEFPRQWLSLTGGDVDKEAVEAGEQLNSSLSRTLERCLQSYLADGYPSIELASELVCCSSRTLQRRLRAEGSSYRQVVQRARFDAAQEMLADQEMPVTFISRMLGYSETAAFSRAFYGWAGCSPTEYRRWYSGSAAGI